MAQAAALLGPQAPAAAPSPLRAVQDPTGEAPVPPTHPRLDLADLRIGPRTGARARAGDRPRPGPVLVRRGLGDPRLARDFLAADARHDPGAFTGIEAALATIRTPHRRRQPDHRPRRLRRRRRVRDGDHGAGPAQPRRRRRTGILPSRIDDGYGLAAATVERLAARGTALLITVDCAITAVEEVAAARAAGHRRRRHRSSRSARRRPSARLSDRPSRAVRLPVRRTCAGRRSPTSWPGARAPAPPRTTSSWWRWPPSLTWCRSWARTAAWSAPGLAALAATAKPGLRALMTVCRADPSALDASTLGFRLAPRINAAGRLHRADAGLELLLTEDPERAREIATELDTVNARAPRRRAAHPVGGRGPGGASSGRGPRSAMCWPPRAGIPGWSGSSPRGSSSATTGPRS